jgi:hypothetical protein
MSRSRGLYLVCLMGVTAARDIALRGWFIAKGAPVIMILEPEKQNDFRAGFAHFCWLSKLLGKHN